MTLRFYPALPGRRAPGLSIPPRGPPLTCRGPASQLAEQVVPSARMEAIRPEGQLDNTTQSQPEAAQPPRDEILSQQSEYGASSEPTEELIASAPPRSTTFGPEAEASRTESVSLPEPESQSHQNAPSPAVLTSTGPESPMDPAQDPPSEAAPPQSSQPALHTSPTYNFAQLPNWGFSNQAFRDTSRPLSGSAGNATSTVEGSTVPVGNDTVESAETPSVGQSAEGSDTVDDKGKGKSASVDEEPNEVHGV